MSKIVILVFKEIIWKKLFVKFSLGMISFIKKETINY
jgi:hypothetical protein